MLGDPRSSAMDLAKLVSQDQVLVERLLKITNSALYGLSREITTIHHGIVILGQLAVRNLVLGISMTAYMSKPKKESLINRKKFWSQSFYRAIIARHIAKKALPEFKEEAFIAGLIQDTGKLIFDEYFTEAFRQVLLESEKAPQMPVCKIERDILGMDHQEIGAWLMKKWHFPLMYIDTTRYHHQPVALKAKSDHYRITAVASLADLVSGMIDLPKAARQTMIIDPEVSADLRWMPTDTEALLAQAQQEFNRASLIF
jgi:HD-like signal output (HDOD) protein